MSRIRERQAMLEPSRLEFAKEQLENRGFTVEQISKRAIKAKRHNVEVKIFPYTGWFTGKFIKDGRGIFNLLKQLDKVNTNG